MEEEAPVTKKQRILILNELELNPALSYDREVNKQASEKKWQKLVENLNEVPNGARKSLEEWKKVWDEWQTEVQARADAAESEGGPPITNKLEKRIVKINSLAAFLKHLDYELTLDLPAMQTENRTDNVVPARSPSGTQVTMKMKKPKMGKTGLGPGDYLNPNRKMKSLKALCDNDPDASHKRMVRRQLGRLHIVSQQLENHIQAVQDRIQMIKETWQHECMDILQASASN